MPATGVRRADGSDEGHFGAVACLGGSLFRRFVWDGSRDLAAVSGLSGADFHALPFMCCFGVQVKDSAMVVTPLWIIDERSN